MRTFVSPVTGAPLRRESPHALAGDAERWPVIDGIPYLRAGSRDRAAEAVARLDAGDETGATALLLAENDPWWDEAPPPEDALRETVEARDGLSLRGVMAALGWGRVGDYFAHRWSDPTFLAGLALLDRHWPAPGGAFELCCGIGHYLRALRGARVPHVGGADIVFGKLWVCRHWVCPEADLVCFDAEAEIWPIGLDADLVTCPDAFYFLRDKPAVAARLRAGARRLYAVPHVHNAEGENHSEGASVSAGALRALFPGARLYDDAALTRAGAAGDAPRPLDAASLAAPDAISLVGGAALGEPDSGSALLEPEEGTPLRRNPLLGEDGAVAWPSARYEAEYAALATYGGCAGVPETARMRPSLAPLVRRRALLDLPARW